ncbi:LacI family DNA-binding transcriptional regulator [Arthrobacter sp. ISL-85]|uniref:LacI family DNA-binding transcriptional regulator n=1 Tax=Arthrobacter sp. ISL-85 TaxID=2819115 RepID=UPI001BEBE31C|nr:LacI family DNA-binding transcriptional regulator [Arthrobacter sp. ISL-85]MBT2568177.1 LacI family DNA-binding transcriptional regulator [Arthrobacter sp. ISL-85]
MTLQDVAEHAGVSRAAASMVVRGTGRLSDGTRKRVRQSMETLGYVYHRGAATLRTNRSGLLGLVLTDISNPFFSSMALGFEEVAAAAGFMTMVTSTYDEADRQDRVVQTMREYPVDGLAYAPSLGSIAPSMSVPTLAITRRSQDGSPSLRLEEVKGGFLAADHMATVHGARKFVYLGGPEGAVPGEERVEGVKQALSGFAGAQLVGVLRGKTSAQGGIELADRLLSTNLSFDAVLCHSDVIAYALLHALRTEQPGRDPVGVIGFDGLPESALFNPAVTSVAVGPEEMGRRAAQWLLDALDGNVQSPLAPMEPHLEVRGSCGCAETETLDVIGRSQLTSKQR